MSVAVREIDQSDKKQKEEYDSLYNDALEAVQKAQKEEGLEAPSDFAFAKFYDISLLDGKTEVEPDSAVDVKISFGKDLQKELKTADPDRVHIVHFAVDKETGEVTPEVLDTDTTDITVKNNKVTEAAFKADSFSIYAVVYTVVIGSEDDGVYHFEGEDYNITITCPEEAHIPAGTKLAVSELDPDSDEYIQRLGQAWYEVNREYFEVEEKREKYEEWMGDLPDLNLVNLDAARFFDISFDYNGEEFEPEEAVTVEISYDEGLKALGDCEPISGVAHFGEKDVELIEDVETETDENGGVVSFKYEQSSFSDTGTYVGQETYDAKKETVTLPAPAPKQYPMLQKKSTTKALKAAANNEDLPAPVATKTLTPNKVGDKNDGTDTLELAVDGHATNSTETTINKSNVLIVMDRSSSMINNIGSTDVTHVATYWNGNYYRPETYNRWSPTEGVTYYGLVNSNGSNRYRELFYNNGQFYYYDSQGVTTATTRSYTGNIYTSTRRTRLDEEQEALGTLIHDLLAKNGEGTTDDGVSLEDIVEISVISFAKDRMDENDGTPHPSSEQDWSTDYDDLMGAVNDQYAPSGTNWEQALRYAMKTINDKKEDPTQAGEDYYLIFLTDGEPTSTKNHHSSAYYYGSTAADYMPAYEAARDYVRDGSGIAAAEDIHFYGIMTWATNDIMRTFLKRLVNVGNGNVSNETDLTTDAVANYYFDADSLSKLEEAFGKIFNFISDTLQYEQVSIADGLTTDAMTTTLVNGSTKGFKYTVYNGRVVDENGKVVSAGTPVYTVTAQDNEGGEPTVTFNINGTNYNAGPSKTYTYNEVQEDGTTVQKKKPYYSVIVGEGENAVEYKMALAEKNGAQLTWDLAAVGALEDGYTYAVSFVVWPDQDAYDYVAALNNGLTKIKDSHGNEVNVDWDRSTETEENKVTDSNGNSYWKNGVNDYPSIVKYTDGTYAVLTNTDQSLKYTIAKTETVNDDTTVTYDGPYTSNLPTPDPMPLTASFSQIEKVWNIERDPDILAELLYGDSEHPYTIGFDILQDDNENPYTSVGLGWDEEQGEYIWNSDDLDDSDDFIYVRWDEGANKFVKCAATDDGAKPIGTHWTKDFSIATGLMLSEARMEALGLDKSAYTHTMYPAIDGTKYYLIEEGHDYTIDEPDVGFEFDFEAPVYHPMLVDGVLMDVDLENIVKDEQGKVISFDMTGMNSIEAASDGRSALTIANTLRGYINVDKDVVGRDDRPLQSDLTDFIYIVEMNNEDASFIGNSIPWYGIGGLFYHDEDSRNYYQVETRNSQLFLTTEDGGPYEASCSGGGGFNPNIITAQTITYIDTDDVDENGNGKEKSVVIYGNRMTPSEGDDENGYTKVTATLHINQNQTLNVANVPVGTTYSITETDDTGYRLMSIMSEVNGVRVDTPDIEGGTISGEIVPNNDNHIVYTNKRIVTDISIKKTDEAGEGLPGAVFQLLYKGENDETYRIVTEEDGIPGLDSIIVEGTTYPSAFESDGGEKILTRLPDGYYKLDEIRVPAGYINTLGSIYFEINNGAITSTTAADSELVDLAISGTIKLLTIANEPGAELPHAGGIGTTIFYVLGSVLAIGSAVFLVARRRIRRI